MSTTFVLVWVLVTGPYGFPTTYSPPVQTLEDCKRMQEYLQKGKCVQINVLRGAQR